MSDSIIRVEQNNPKNKTIGVKNIEPISNIKIIRDYSDSDVSSDDSISVSNSSYSSEPEKKVKKTKKVLRRKVYQPPSDYTAFSNPRKISKREESDDESEYSSESSASGYSQQANEEDAFAEKQKMKQDLLIKIQALEKKGFEFSKKFNMTSNYDEIAFEYEKIKKFIETQSAIKFSRRCLMACVTGLEFVNKKFDPFSIKLEGWSENVMENVDDYDNIFEKLHEKYSSKAEIAPEIELLLTLGGSAFMFHLTNSLLKSPIMSGGDSGGFPGMVAQNNPNFMANMMSSMSQGMKEMAKPPQMGKTQSQQPGPPKPMDTRGVRKEMNGPSIDQSLFNGTPLMHNYPKPPQPVPHYTYDNINDDDRYSIASSDSSLSSVRSIRPTKKKTSGGGIELNIS